MSNQRALVEYSRPRGKAVQPYRRPGLRTPFALIIFAFTAVTAFVFVNVVDPYSGATASPYFQLEARYAPHEAQTVQVAGGYDLAVTRDGFSVEDPPPPPPPPPPVVEASFSAPAAAIPDPGSAQAYAHGAVLARGWGEGEFSCLVALWNRESGWNVNAMNPHSGAYGIPQSLPGNKMASAGGDWETNAATQIEWGLGYIQNRYGAPCGAWSHSENNGWY